MSSLQTHLAAAAVGALLAAGVVATGMGWRADARVNEIKAQHAEAVVAAVEAAREEERRLVAAKAVHATASTENEHVFLEDLERQRDAAARNALAAERLRLDADRRAATYRAMSEAGAAACGDLADQHAALDRHVVAGVAVVGALRGDLERRDAEVKALVGQITADRALFGEAP